MKEEYEAQGLPSSPLEASSGAQQDGSAECPGATVVCQVLGCSAALDPAGKQYCYKKRTCAACMQANAVLLSDRSCTAYRFCQQCGKFESIEKFDGSKRSCRARLAKRRSGTRAQLLKKNCLGRAEDPGSPWADQQQHIQQQLHSLHDAYSLPLPSVLLGAHSTAMSELQSSLLLAEQQSQQLLMAQQLPDLQQCMLLQQQLPPHGGMCGAEGSLSDAAPTAAAAAAASSVAATMFAASARPRHALSAPMPLVAPEGDGSRAQESMLAAAAAAGGEGNGDGLSGGDSDAAAEGVMTQAEVLATLRGEDAGSGSWQHSPQHTGNTGSTADAAAVAAEAAAAAAVSAGMAAATAGFETSCSLPLANLCIATASCELPHLHATDAAVAAAAGTAACAGSSACGGCMPGVCWSLPLAAYAPPASAGEGMLPPHQQQQTMQQTMQQQQQQQQQQLLQAMQRSSCSSSGRLKWLIQQMQQELQSCGASQLDTLDNTELSTLLCAALAPASAAAAAGAGGDAGRPGSVAAAEAIVAAATAAVGAAPDGGGRAAPAQADVRAELAAQVGQVQQLQQQVEQLQQHLAHARGAPLSSSSMSAAATAAASALGPLASGSGVDAGLRPPVAAPASRSAAASLAAAIAEGHFKGEAHAMPRPAGAGDMGMMVPNAGSVSLGRPSGAGGSGVLNNFLPAAPGAMGSYTASSGLSLSQRPWAEQQQLATRRAPGGGIAAMAQFMALQRQLRDTEAQMLSMMHAHQQQRVQV